MNKRYCRVCGVKLSGNNFYPSRIGKRDYICKMCHSKYINQWKDENPEKCRMYSDTSERRQGHLPMSENKDCSMYLGVHVAERVLRHIFKNVEQMPHGNSGYDVICGLGYKIDIKAGCVRNTQRSNNWMFHIRHNTIADFFLCIAFDNIEDLNPLHIWLIPGKDVNDHDSIGISKSTIGRWDKYQIDKIDQLILCCDTLRGD
jgi:hypothetical protein